MAWADTIEEIKTVCWCGRKATMNARVMDGKVVKAGEQIVLGGNESYVALCRKHWAKGELAPLEIRRISSGREAYMPLLLEADPSESNIKAYLYDGELYVLLAKGKTAGAAIIAMRPDGALELKNLAVAQEVRGLGYGAELLKHVFGLSAPRSEKLYVGTSPANIPFYEKFGFRQAYTVEDYFVKNYDEPILEAGKPLRDMIYLVKEL